MKLYVDDVRECPEGYSLFRNSAECLQFIIDCVTVSINHPDEKFEIEVVSLDHDMGGAIGGDCINILNKLEYLCNTVEGFDEIISKIKFHLHSSNPVGVANMRAVIKKNGWKEMR